MAATATASLASLAASSSRTSSQASVIGQRGIGGGNIGNIGSIGIENNVEVELGIKQQQQNGQQQQPQLSNASQALMLDTFMNQNTILWKRIKDNEQIKRNCQEQNKKLYVLLLHVIPFELSPRLCYKKNRAFYSNSMT